MKALEKRSKQRSNRARKTLKIALGKRSKRRMESAQDNAEMAPDTAREMAPDTARET